MSATWRQLAVFSLLVVSGCSVDPAVYAGRACDDAHPCADGRVCGPAGLCVEPGGGGSPDGSTGVPGACVRWRQTEQGFQGSSACPTCELTLDAANGNRLTARIPSAADGSDYAWAKALLPSTLTAQQGRIRGDLRVSGAEISNRTTFLLLDAGGVEVIQLYFLDKDEVGSSSASGTLQPNSLSQVRETSDFDDRGTLTFDLTWKRGEYRRLEIDGELILGQTLTPLTGEAPDITELRLGIDGYSGASLSGWTLELSNWLYCDDPAAPL